MTSVIIRIVLRYTAAFFVARGFLPADVGATVAMDSDLIQVIQLVLGASIGVAAEVWYYAARHFGWPQ